MVKTPIIFILTALALLVSSCAIIQPPSGGEKDEDGPQILKSTPLIGSTNYHEKKIVLQFDEFISLNNFLQELTVSPPLHHPVEYKIKGKSVEVKFQDTLLENTTYTFNFGDGIVDYHEGNPLDSNVMVFSTGPEIDSGFVSGYVQDAFTLQPLQKVLVMLYADHDDSIPAQKKPMFFAKTDLNGNFELNYLKSGKYQVFVLEDLNSNYLYDMESERIGFAPELISIEGAIGIANAEIKLFKESQENQFYIGQSQGQYGKIQLGFNQAIENLVIKPINEDFGKDWYFVTYDNERDTAYVWTTIEPLEEGEYSFELYDNDELIDTLEIKPREFPTEEKVMDAIQPRFNLNDKNGVVKFFAPLTLSTEVPISSQKIQGIVIRNQDSIAVNGKLIDPFTIQLDVQLKQESNYNLYIYDSCISNVLEMSHDTLRYTFRTLSEMEYANLKIELVNQSSDPLIIQLLQGEGNEVLEERFINQESKLNFKNLEPGKYKMKMIFDSNSNQQWDAGTFIPRKQPERVIYFSEEIEMKEGWDKKISWTIPE